MADDDIIRGGLDIVTDKKKINRRQSKKPPSLRLRGLKKTEGSSRTAPAFGSAVNKPKAEQETAQPTAARFKKNKPKAGQETAQPTAARFNNRKQKFVMIKHCSEKLTN